MNKLTVMRFLVLVLGAAMTVTAKGQLVTDTVRDQLSVIFPVDRFGRFTSRADTMRLGRAATDFGKLNQAGYRMLSLSLHGYASPEATWEHNTMLARERARSFLNYFSRLSDIDTTLVTVTSTPEDWIGTRRYAENARWSEDVRRGVLNIIDNTPDPDRRLWLIRIKYPKAFDELLHVAFPPLRRVDYKLVMLHTYMPLDALHLPLEMPKPGTLSILPRPVQQKEPRHMRWAIENNLLFDAALAPNIAVEVPVGKNYKYSILAEMWMPWYVWHHNSRAYQVLYIGTELRRWPRRKSKYDGQILTGWFYGAYAGGGKYDLEWGSTGNQGEYGSVGVSGGYCIPIAHRLNMEFSAAVGAVVGPWRHYHGMFHDHHLIWQHDNNTLFYIGPTKLKVSLCWLFPERHKKGGLR